MFKLGAVLSTFVAMPILIKYLGVELFGIWATMLTLVSWIMLFDLGIGNGLKNKVSESIAIDNPQLASYYISTAYILIGVISLSLFLIFLMVSFWVSWQSVFNTHVVNEISLRNSIITLGFFIFFNFWISLVNQIYHGLQRSSVVVFGQFLSNAFALIAVYVLFKFTEKSMIYVIYAYGVSLVASNLLLSFILFKTRNDFWPRYALFQSEKVKPLLNLGIKFFIIQLAVLTIFMTDKILITQLLGPAQVTPYEVLFKLFSIFTIVHSLVLVPLWPAYSDAYARQDYDWIRSQIKKQVVFALGLFLGTIILAFTGPEIVGLWIGEGVKISHSLYFMFALFIILSIWSNIFAYFVSAINKVGFQLVTAVLAAIINIPLSILFVKYFNLGLNGIMLATIVSLSLYSIVGPYQVSNILKKSIKNGK